MLTHLKPPVYVALGGILAILLVASGVVTLLKRLHPDKPYLELTQRIRSWWVMIGVFAGAMMLSRTASVIFYIFR